MRKRKIVQIDEAKCDGCGLCVPSCQEGAIRIVAGKARLVSDTYCDGLGACLGHCPRGAVSIVEREAAPFDEAAVARHAHAVPASLPVVTAAGGCPGTAARQLRTPGRTAAIRAEMGDTASQAEPPSRLANWPLQLHLVPPQAPYLRGADLLLVADCVPLAYAGFHGRFLDGRPVAIGCPKLDDTQAYVQKLAQILRVAALRRLTILRMEVPCCSGLVHIARAAMETAGTQVPLDEVTISIQGQILTPSPRCESGPATASA